MRATSRRMSALAAAPRSPWWCVRFPLHRRAVLSRLWRHRLLVCFSAIAATPFGRTSRYCRGRRAYSSVIPLRTHVLRPSDWDVVRRLPFGHSEPATGRSTCPQTKFCSTLEQGGQPVALKCRKPTSGRWSGRATPRSLARRGRGPVTSPGVSSAPCPCQGVPREG